ncbi:hypothetical protein F0L74_19585 [Chitinophaga agrisoli]|uniref:Uncharacterized protein n=1 Tax=Chitinophaga agrisoli TaxID=2607653 RepID=A0A5B2VJA2_9BACT|nr:hypothetical protein [Chitinophaga agrisoli]KAA2238432.1 hypothetical protein F0L74_19585 [Chitinophaga agrisoli]
MKATKPYPLLLLLLLFLFACSPLISRYNEYAYQQTTALKVDVMLVMDMAADSFSTHQKELAALRVKVDKAYEYEIHRPNNRITIEMWQLLKDSSRNLLGGYLKRWQQDTKLNPVFIQEAKQQVGEAFDKIAELESGKVKN